MQDIAEVRLLFVFGAHPAHGEVLRKAFTGKGNELCVIGQGNSNPTGEAKLNLQSLRSVDNRS